MAILTGLTNVLVERGGTAVFVDNPRWAGGGTSR
jgi:hypothetical protein